MRNKVVSKVTSASAFIALLCIVQTVSVGYGQSSVSISNGFATYTMGLQIEQTPKWAHDMVLSAAEAWNMAQIWYRSHFNQPGPVYTFVEVPIYSMHRSHTIFRLYRWLSK